MMRLRWLSVIGLVMLPLMTGCGQKEEDHSWDAYSTTPSTDGQPYIDNDAYYVAPHNVGGEICTINDMPSSNCIN